MRGIPTRWPQRRTARARARFAFLAMALSVFAGCATGGKVGVPAARVEAPAARAEDPADKAGDPAATVDNAAAAVETPGAGAGAPAPEAETRVAPEPAAPRGPSVARLADGREGFIITEVPAM